MEKPYLIDFILALVIAVIAGTLLIPWLKKLRVGQSIREEGPQTHMKKSGTPTIGGLIFILATVLVSLVKGLWKTDAIVILVSMLAFGLVGFLDDYIIVVKKRNLGLTARQKLAGQILASVIVLALYIRFKGTAFPMILPFTGGRSVQLGLWWGIPLFVFVLVATTNSVNLTDGLDGLASGMVVFYMIFVWLIARDIHEPIAHFAMILAASLLGFLFYNHYPAKVFMGDTGSLALGAAVATAPMMLDLTLFIPIAGLVFVLETLSVMIQVFAYKRYKKRVFLMSPLHHHFEQKGWEEVKVVKVFYIAAVVCMIVAYMAY